MRLAVGLMVLAFGSDAFAHHPLSVLDRYEDATYAVLLQGPQQKELVISRRALPFPTEEGTWLRLQSGHLSPDLGQTVITRRRMERKRLRLRLKSRSFTAVVPAFSSEPALLRSFSGHQPNRPRPIPSFERLR